MKGMVVRCCSPGASNQALKQTPDRLVGTPEVGVRLDFLCHRCVSPSQGQLSLNVGRVTWMSQ